jgi:hypothetical protein
MYIHVYTRIYAYTFIYIFTHVCMYICGRSVGIVPSRTKGHGVFYTSMYFCICVLVNICSCMSLFTCFYLCIYVCTYKHKYVFMLVYTYICTYILFMYVCMFCKYDIVTYTTSVVV